jgi:hypothetical protein
MLTLIHGGDTAASRKYFSEQKDQHADAHVLNGETVTLTDLSQILEGGGLFTETKAVFIEQLFTQKKKKETFATIVAYLEKNSSSHNIYLWEGKELDRGALMTFKTAMQKAFKLPQTLFVLLDSLKPGNGEQLIKLFHQSLESAEAEMIFFMLIRQVRLMIALSNENENPIDEVKRMAPWQKDKLKKQAALFSQAELQDLYNRLFSIEIGQKTGQLPNTILTSIDFLLLSI